MLVLATRQPLRRSAAMQMDVRGATRNPKYFCAL
jgi:hypothetical protein